MVDTTHKNGDLGMVYGIGFTTSFRMMNLYGSLGFKTNGES